MPSPSESEKLRTKTSYQVRPFQSFAAGWATGVQALPGAVVGEAATDGAEDGGTADAGGPDGAGVGPAGEHAATSSTTVASQGVREVGRRTPAVYCGGVADHRTAPGRAAPR